MSIAEFRMLLTHRIRVQDTIFPPIHFFFFCGNQTKPMEKWKEKKTYRRARSYGEPFEYRNRDANQSRVVERSQFRLRTTEDPRRQLQTTGPVIVIVAGDSFSIAESRRTKHGIEESLGRSEHQWLSSSHHWHRTAAKP